MTQDGEASASASAAAERPPEPVEQEMMRVLLQDRQNFPSLRHSSHPSDLDRRQNGRSFDGMAASFRSDTKTRAKNIAEGAGSGQPGLSPGLRPLILSHTHVTETNNLPRSTAPPHNNTKAGSLQQKPRGSSSGLQSSDQALRGVQAPPHPPPPDRFTQLTFRGQRRAASPQRQSEGVRRSRRAGWRLGLGVGFSHEVLPCSRL